jgi:hypothetical protein
VVWAKGSAGLSILCAMRPPGLPMQAISRILLRLLQHHVAGRSRDTLPEGELLAGITPEVAAISRYRP